jgi:glucokinase
MKTLGVDVGGTNARAAIVDEHGRILSVAKAKLTERSVDGVIESIAAAAQRALHDSPVKDVTSCGVGFAGQLDGESGFVLVAPNLGWRDVPFGELLGKRIRCSVRVVNDLSAAAWGEFCAGAAQGVRDVLTVFVGSGVGSAIIANGILVHGVNGLAGEFGHMKVVPGGRQCGCGERGCVEAYVGGVHLIAQMEEVIAQSKSPALARLTNGSSPTPVHLEEAALAGDPAAKAIYERAIELLALALGNQVTMLNPARVILGGGVLANTKSFRGQVEKRALEVASPTSRRSLEVKDAALGDDSGLIGAALLAVPT